MQYANGQEVQLGDRVKLGSDDGGVVVCSIDLGQYSDECPEKDWSYLKKGILVRFPQFGLIHYPEFDPELELIARQSD